MLASGGLKPATVGVRLFGCHLSPSASIPDALEQLAGRQLFKMPAVFFISLSHLLAHVRDVGPVLAQAFIHTTERTRPAFQWRKNM